MASYTETGGYCDHCEERVVVRRRSPNNILHFLLTFVTFGLWLPVWIISNFQMGGWRCSHCGSKASTRVPGAGLANLSRTLAVFLYLGRPSR